MLYWVCRLFVSVQTVCLGAHVVIWLGLSARRAVHSCLLEFMSCLLLDYCNDCVTLAYLLSCVVARCECSHSGVCSAIDLQCCT